MNDRSFPPLVNRIFANNQLYHERTPKSNKHVAACIQDYFKRRPTDIDLTIGPPREIFLRNIYYYCIFSIVGIRNSLKSELTLYCSLDIILCHLSGLILIQLLTKFIIYNRRESISSASSIFVH